MGASATLTGCTLEDKNQIMETVQSTTNSVATEYSSDMAKVLLADAIARSIDSQNVKMTGTQNSFSNGLMIGSRNIEVLEKVENNNTGIIMSLTYKSNKADVEDLKYISYIIFCEDAYYLIDKETNNYSKINDEFAYMGASTTLTAILPLLNNCVGAKYVNGSLQVNIQEVSGAGSSTVVTISKDGYISDINQIEVEGIKTNITNTSFEYNNVVFPEDMPSSLEGYSPVV